MTPLLIALLVTVAVLGGAFFLGLYLLRKTGNRTVGYTAIGFISLPFAWTLFYGASSGGGVMLPCPDVVAIFALLSGEFHSGNYSAAGSIPPPFVMSVISFFVAYNICKKQRPDLFERKRRK